MMEILWSLRRPTFNISFFNNLKSHNGNKENVTSSSQGYNKLGTTDDEPQSSDIGLSDFTPLPEPPAAATRGATVARGRRPQRCAADADSTSDVTPAGDVTAPGDYRRCGYTGDHSEDFSLTDDEDDRTCIVCDLTFITRKHLRYHQKKKRHYGCSVCEDVFGTRIALEYHKEDSDHWTVSDDEDEFMNQADDDVMESEDDEQLLFY